MRSNFPDQIRKAIESHHMFGPADRIVVGVSGGADSVSLALALHELGYKILTAHVNHSLRGSESDGDESFSAALAQRLGVEFFTRKVTLLHGNTEAAGRDARRDFFNELRQTHGAAKIALAHTRNDRVETFLLNLLRGSGTAGLVSMAPVAGTIVRPLIDIERADVEIYLRENGETWREDASNRDLDFARNHLRHEVIPQLESGFNPNFIETISRTIDILEHEDEWMNLLSREWLAESGTKEEASFVLDVDKLRAAPIALVRRVLRAALKEAGSDLRDVSFEHLEGVRALLEPHKSGKRVEIRGGMLVAREFDHLVFRETIAMVPEYEYELAIPGSVQVPELKKVFRAEVVTSEAVDSKAQRVFVDADSIGPCVRIRNWKPGDYYRPVGLPAGKLKKLFQRARIPRSHRASWPVVCADSTIVWVASFPVSREFAPRGCSQKIVAIEAVQI